MISRSALKQLAMEHGTPLFVVDHDQLGGIVRFWGLGSLRDACPARDFWRMNWTAT